MHLIADCAVFREQNTVLEVNFQNMETGNNRIVIIFFVKLQRNFFANVSRFLICLSESSQL